LRDNRKDSTIERNYIQQYRFLIAEYDSVKDGRHALFRTASQFYLHHGLNRQTFAKYYHRFKREQSDEALLPRKRGPRWKSRRTDLAIEQQVCALRERGASRYDIYRILQPELGDRTPAPSTIYRILQRNDLNRLSKPMQEEKRRIIKTRAGELGHLDCHYLAKGVVAGTRRRSYLVAVLDDCTRLAWAEVTDDLKSLTVMFAALKSINLLNAEYGVRFEAMLTDNGAEVASPHNKQGHPLERMLLELGVTHRYTKPYRPQTNGKVERFWRTLNEDLLDGTTFESVHELKDELLQYLLYYNTHRPHQALGGKTPWQVMQDLSTN
jgi:transposase InsO family protein